MPVERDHAVVVGGSIAGMTAARTLSRHFARVTIVERDQLIDDLASKRRGAPQMHQTHGLLMIGTTTLDELYGSFSETMRAQGCADFDAGQQSLTLDLDGWVQRAPTGLRQISATRVMIERVIRELTLRESRIVLCQGHAERLLSTADRRRVTGVEVRGDDGATKTIEAELVVDACGRGTKAPKWIEDLGYTPPAVSFVRPFLGYATVHCTLPDDLWPGDIRQIDVPPVNGLTTRGGNIMQEENGLVGFTAHGQGRDYPPGDPEGFVEFLRAAISPILYEMWKRAEPITDVRTTKTSANRLNHWHDLQRRPEGFVAVGDSVAAFNPLYGQGMSGAILHARRLGEVLQEADTLEEVVRRFAGEAFELSKFPWEIATQGDLEWPATEVENMPEETIAIDGTYFRRLRRLVVEDAEVAAALLRTVHYFRLDDLVTPQMREKVARSGDLPLGMPDGVSLPPDIAEALDLSAPVGR